MEQSKYSISDIIEEEEDQRGWLVTYADLMTLLLVFFILMYAISSLNLEKFKRVVSSIQVSLGEKRPPVELLEIVETPAGTNQKVSLAYLSGLRSREQKILNDIDDMIEEKKMGQHIVAHLSKGKIHIQIRGKVLFESGSAELNNDAKPILEKIAKIIKDYGEYSVNIKGHTDNTPISTVQFASNWELSAIRSTTVLKSLIDGGIDPTRLTATGYGDFLPLVPNDSADNRAINRRVEFVLEKRTE
ncbi:MAG: flagellar motor protein MotB [Pseudomonadota bacterium]|uniref:OmpA family protein n=1 Tax=Candidatus Desulfatibia profunda TaxID=2841695 RepID=A0A8J6NSW3_9BACT|nr:OmpA family protein [Candidatus Desulfatibia profunda]MBL7179977.1 OmpA family protein [Desulfobacterales bacterium]